jgi:hypothetical protein
MSLIPVERRRRGVPWWVLLVAGLIGLALLFVLLSGILNSPRRDQTAGGSPRGSGASLSPAAGSPGVSPLASDGAGPSGPAVTDGASGDGVIGRLRDLLVDDQSSLVGRSVDIASVNVQRVVGDTTFWVGRDAERRVFAVLAEEGTELERGQAVRLLGTVRALSGPEAFDLSPEDAATLESETIYIEATQVEAAGG